LVDDDRTHYEVLGVDPSADKEAIRAAYQSRIEAAHEQKTRAEAAKKPDQNAIASARDEEGRVRAAWQVLSDPYQRGRYDATVELGAPSSDADGDDADRSDDGDGSAVAAATPARRERPVQRDRRGREIPPRPPGLFSAEHLPTPASWPAGYRPPPNRARMLAMLIDLLVLMVLYVGLSVGGYYAVKDAYPKESKQYDNASDCVDKINNEKSLDTHKLGRIESIESFCKSTRGGNVKFTSASKLAKMNKSDRIDDDLDKATTRRTDIDKKRGTGKTLASLATIIVLLLYLIPSSVRSGRTLGKRLMVIRVINQDGSRLTLRGALLRYGLPIVAALTIGQFFGPLAFALVLFGVLTWPRNPNFQGLHDRLAKTIVVDG